ncbi:hypothetical protein P3T23_009409 [Paraburkholderia sp. GAS448]
MKAFRVIAIVLAFNSLAACTLIYVEGNSNSISDTGGHDAKIALPTGR